MGRDDGRGDERAAFMCVNEGEEEEEKEKRRNNTRRSRRKKRAERRVRGSTVKCALVVGVPGITLISLIFGCPQLQRDKQNRGTIIFIIITLIIIHVAEPNRQGTSVLKATFFARTKGPLLFEF